MLTNLETMREQNAVERMDEVLEEIPRVREDQGYSLVTPTSQIVGTGGDQCYQVSATQALPRKQGVSRVSMVRLRARLM